MTAQTSFAAPANGNRKRSFSKRGLVSILTLVILFIIPASSDDPFFHNIITLVFLWGAMAGAWNILGGYAGKFSLGNAIFFGTGAYTSSILYNQLGLTPWIGMFAGIGLSIIFALILGMITLRLRGTFFCLCTIAVISLMEIICIHLRGLTGGAEGLLIEFKPGLSNMIFDNDRIWSYVMLVFMLGVYFFTRWLERNQLGYRWVALRENEDAAESLGINTLNAKLSAFVVSAVLTSIGGTLYAQYCQFIEPVYVYSLDLSIQFALYAIIGGMGTAIGPLLGAIIITPLMIILRSSFPELASGASMALYAFLLIIGVLFFPQGFASVLDKISHKLFGDEQADKADQDTEASHAEN